MVIERRFISVNGIRTHFIESGQGYPLVLVHGLGASSISWSENVDPLSRHYRVIALDVPGHGDSEKPDNVRYNMYSGANFLDAFLDTLSIPRATIVGNSAGGLIAAQFAISKPQRLDALVLVDTGGLGRELRWFLRFASLPILGEFLENTSVRNTRALLRSIFYAPRPMEDGLLQELMRVRNLPGAKTAALECIRSHINLWGMKRDSVLTEKLRSLSMPLLIVWGEEDQIIPVSHARRAMELLPQAVVRIIPRCGHWPQMERPDEFNQIVVNFLQGSLIRAAGR